MATQRGYGNYASWWEFPEGKIEARETTEEALVRKIREEQAAKIHIEKQLMQVEYECREFFLTMECFWYTIDEEELTLLEHKDMHWLHKEELRENKWLPADDVLRHIETDMLFQKNN